jgi:hypothetical protein
MHVHMKPAELQHVQAPVQAKRTEKAEEPDGGALAAMYGEEASIRRHRQSPKKNGPFNPPNGSRKALAAALHLLDLFGPEESQSADAERPTSSQISDLLTSVTL